MNQTANKCPPFPWRMSLGGKSPGAYPRTYSNDACGLVFIYSDSPRPKVKKKGRFHGPYFLFLCFWTVFLHHICDLLVHCHLATAADGAWVAIASDLSGAANEFYIIACAINFGCYLFVRIIGGHVHIYLWNQFRVVCPYL